MGLKFYKKGQGYYTRLGTGIGAGILAALGCWSLYYKLGGIQSDNLSASALLWIQAGVPGAVFAILAWLIFKLVNYPKFADFLISTEGEMKKVSWSTRKELTSSTLVVIITVAIMAAILAVVDFSFHELFVKLGILVN